MKSVMIALRKLRPLVGRNNIPIELAFRDLTQNFQTTSTLNDTLKVWFQSRGRSGKEIKMNFKKRSAYKIQRTQEFQEKDHQKRCSGF